MTRSRRIKAAAYQPNISKWYVDKKLGEVNSDITAINGDITTINNTLTLISPNVQTLTPTGTTETINWSSGAMVVLDTSSATGDITLTLSNPVAGQTYMIIAKHGATARSLIFPAGTLQVGAAGTTVTASGINQDDVIAVGYDGTNYYINKSENYA